MPFDFEVGIWNATVLMPDQCLSFSLTNSSNVFFPRDLYVAWTLNPSSFVSHLSPLFCSIAIITVMDPQHVNKMPVYHFPNLPPDRASTLQLFAEENEVLNGGTLQ